MDSLSTAGTKAHRILAAMAARRLLARGVRNDILRAKIESNRLTDEEIELLAADIFETCVLAATGLDKARSAAKAYASRVAELGLAADDNDPKVMATAEPIGEAQADLYATLGIYLCDFRHEHDTVNDRPMGDMCGKDATHVITWEDGRHSFGCSSHLEIERAATVKPLSIVPLGEVDRG